MTDFIIQDNENVTLTIEPVDALGNPVGAFDAGSVTATFPETSNLTAELAADQTSVLVTALGPLTSDDVLTIAGDVGGVSVSVQFPFDVDAGPVASIGVTPGTPALNATSVASVPTTDLAQAPAADASVPAASDTGAPSSSSEESASA